MNDEEILKTIETAFEGAEKPNHFNDFEHCLECQEHDELLRSKTKETLTIEDVGNIGWQPISFCNPVGLAYYFPALARLALTKPTYEYDSYAETLAIQMDIAEGKFDFYVFCNNLQRNAVATLFNFIALYKNEYLNCSASKKDLLTLAKQWSV